jgi:threonine aldolase
VAGTGLTGQQAQARLEEQGVRASLFRDTRLRFVTHLDIGDDDIERALDVCRSALKP